MKRFDDKCLDCVESSTINVNLSVLLGKCVNTENLENLESPGILLWHFPGLESLLVLDGSENLLNTSKKYEVCGRQ